MKKIQLEEAIVCPYCGEKHWHLETEDGWIVKNKECSECIEEFKINIKYSTKKKIKKKEENFNFFELLEKREKEAIK